MKTALLAAVVCVLCAVAASSASAELPEIGHCVKQPVTKEGFKKIYGGKYTNKKCTTESKSGNGKFEWVGGPGAEKEFESPGTLEPVNLETPGGTVIACANSKMDGEYTGAQTETDHISLYECKDTATGETCQSLRPEEVPPTAEKGTILSGEVEGKLGFINSHGKKPEVGWEYKAKSGAMFTFECGEPIEIPPLDTSAAAQPDLEKVPTLVTIEGAFIGHVKPVDRPVEEFFFKYLASDGKQVPEKFEGGEPATLTATIEALPSAPVTEPIAYSGVEEESVVEKYEIKALP
jgi:opacity protein-like surface antigen